MGGTVTAPTTAIPAGPSSDTAPVPAATWNGILTHLRLLFGYVLGGFRITRPYVMVHATAGQTVAPTTDVVILFDTEDEDTDNMWSPGLPSQLTVNTPGVYKLTGQLGTHVYVAPSGTQGAPVKVACGLLVNGTTTAALVDASGQMSDQTTLSNTKTTPQVGAGPLTTRRVRLAAGDVVRLYGWQQNGAGLAVIFNTGAFAPTYLTAKWIGP